MTENTEITESTAPTVEIESADGEQILTVTLKAYDAIYAPAGYRLTDESEIDIEKSALADPSETDDSGQSGAEVGRAARKSNKAKDSDRT